MANFANGHGNRATPDYETCHDRFPLSKSPSPRSPPFYFRDECANAKVASENSVIEPITLPKALVVIWERRYCEGAAGSSGDGYLVGLVEQDLINEGSWLYQLCILGLSTAYRQGHPRKLWGVILALGRN